MYYSHLLCLITALAVNTLAAPAKSQLINFFLVTTSQSTPRANSSHLADVSATSLFDPLDQENFLLRLIGPGYLSLPTFNLTHGTLHTLSEGPEGLGEFVYNSTTVQKNVELQFLPEKERKGNLGLKGGYLLTVGGEEKGWSICEGEEDESVIVWKGMNSTCKETYIQAVSKAPY